MEKVVDVGCVMARTAIAVAGWCEWRDRGGVRREPEVRG